jgi:transposase
MGKACKYDAAQGAIIVILNPERQRGLPKSICQISWKNQLRLCARYRMMIARKKPMQVVVIAIDHVLAVFMMAIAKEVEAAA